MNNDGNYSPVGESSGQTGIFPNNQTGLATVIETSKTYGTKAYGFVKERVNIPPLRYPVVFFGLGKEKPFSLPGGSELVTRLKLNLPFYASNYILFYLILCGMSIITSPVSLVTLVLTSAGWYVILKSNPESDSFNIGSFVVKKVILYLAMGVVSIFSGILLIGTLLGWSLWLGCVIALCHSAGRDATELIETAEAEENKFEGDIGSFLQTP
mmetsp:Transcript_20394/g.30161  ORF Transcript_20394/g.30161 Transcript_20394/m.30161 type:complete len:212 (+) Transcript_20394:74-709(+)|eukprot:CAMPEP_0171453442 /NCGR_PEP_ID=MMETSP0945-20130129/1152_1 /TAXON_ID=109269 /ORGANISM="Vaucheria litorea, Strain CCMP2940" /LENGTH=211 /DNA_ID=CAMNT_0011978317 /DNA_START=69 /DNA_END=704 /DNA_ORIENTATION=+